MGTYPRAYLIKDYTKNEEKLSQMTEGQLGDHYYFSTHETAEFKMAVWIGKEMRYQKFTGLQREGSKI